MLCPVLIGREEELGTLTSAVAAAGRGHGGTLVVVGEAGTGKSRLVRELVEGARARGGVTVLVGRAAAGPIQAPYQPLTEAVLRIPFDTLLDLPELRAFRSSLGQLLPDGDPAGVPASSSPLVVGEGLRRLLRVVRGSRPGLLVVEDLHWADRESVAVLDYLAGQAAEESQLVVITLRPGDGGAASAMVDAMLDRRAARAIHLDRLDRQQTAQLTQACLGAAPSVELADFVADWSDGLPFLAEELLASLVSDDLLADVHGSWTLTGVPASLVPPTFAAAVSRRLDTLSPQERDVLHAAAVLGRRFEWRLLAAITGLGDDEVAAALRNATQRQLLSATDDVSFRHALTRTAVLAQLVAPERALLARRALAALEQSDPQLRGAHCELAADLAEQAGLAVRSAVLLLEAGERATRRGALATAETMLRRAAGLAVDDTDLSIAVEDALTDVYAYAGETDRAIELGARLLARIEPGTSSGVDRVALHLRLARVGLAAGRWTLVAEHVAAARRSTGPTTPDAAQSVVDAVDAQLALGRGDLDRAAQVASTALAGAEDHGLPETACEALEVLGRVARQRDLVQAERAFEREAATASAHDLPIWRLRALHELGTIDQLRTESVERLTATRELADQVGAHALLATLDLQIAAGLIKQFRTDEGLAAARRCIDASRRLRLATLPMALVYEATAYAQRRQPAGMEAVLDEALALAPDDFDVQGCAWGHCRATASIMTENRERALQELATGVHLLQQSRATVSPPFLGMHVLLLAVAGQDDEASAAAERVRESEATRHQIVADLLDCADAVLLGRAGRGVEAAEAYARADQAMSPLVTWYRQWARRLVAESALADGWGDPLAWLREAAPFFAARGDEELASACRALLRRAGAPVPRARRGDAAVPAELRALGVTSRELDVWTLVGAGLTNAEIAARLHLSPRTVEKHVASLLTRTGCRRRAELAAYLVRLTG